MLQGLAHGRRHSVRISLYLLVVCLLHVSVNAASQGNIGRNESQGSVSITLHIPDTPQLIAAPAKQSDDAIHPQICLKVFDRNTPSSTGFYTVAGLQGNLPAEYGVGEHDYAQASQRIVLDNLYSKAGQEAGDCQFATTLQAVKPSSADSSSSSANQQRAILFMLIAE